MRRGERDSRGEGREERREGRWRGGRGDGEDEGEMERMKRRWRGGRGDGKEAAGMEWRREGRKGERRGRGEEGTFDWLNNLSKFFQGKARGASLVCIKLRIKARILSGVQLVNGFNCRTFA